MLRIQLPSFWWRTAVLLFFPSRQGEKPCSHDQAYARKWQWAGQFIKKDCSPYEAEHEIAIVESRYRGRRSILISDRRADASYKHRSGEYHDSNYENQVNFLPCTKDE